MNASNRFSRPLLLWRSRTHDRRITQSRTAKRKQFERADRLTGPILPRLNREVAKLARAIFTAFGGPGRMTLAEWRDAEEKLKRKIEYEKANTHQ